MCIIDLIVLFLNAAVVRVERWQMPHRRMNRKSYAILIHTALSSCIARTFAHPLFITLSLSLSLVHRTRERSSISFVCITLILPTVTQILFIIHEVRSRCSCDGERRRNNNNNKMYQNNIREVCIN